MENADGLGIFTSPSHGLTQSASNDWGNVAHADDRDDASASAAAYTDRVKKEFKYNQFFILAETSFQADQSPEPPHLERTYQSAFTPRALDDTEVFHGLLESEDLSIVSEFKDLKPLHDNGSGRDLTPGVDVIEGGLDDETDGLEEGVDCDIDVESSRSVAISEAQSFLNDIKQKSETRSKFLEEVLPSSNFDLKSDAKQVKTELDMIEKLDLKLQQLESAEPSTCSSRSPLPSEGNKCIPSAVLYLRKKRKKL